MSMLRINYWMTSSADNILNNFLMIREENMTSSLVMISYSYMDFNQMTNVAIHFFYVIKYFSYCCYCITGIPYYTFETWDITRAFFCYLLKKIMRNNVHYVYNLKRIWRSWSCFYVYSATKQSEQPVTNNTSLRQCVL